MLPFPTRTGTNRVSLLSLLSFYSVAIPRRIKILVAYYDYNIFFLSVRRYTCEWDGTRDDELGRERAKGYADYVGRRRTWKTLDRHRVPTDVSHFFLFGVFFSLFFFLFFLIGSLKRAPLFRKKIPETDRCASTVCYVLRMALVTAGEPFLGQGYLALSPFLSRSLRPSVCPSRSLYQR